MCLLSWKRAITLEAYEHEVETRSSSTFSVERPGSASVRVTSSCMTFSGFNTPRTECFVANPDWKDDVGGVWVSEASGECLSLYLTY